MADEPSKHHDAPAKVPSGPFRQAATVIDGQAATKPRSDKHVRRPIYATFFGIYESPFDLTPNPRFLFLPPRHREALANLRYAVAAGKGFALLTGEAGTGKTTLIRSALAELDDTPTRCVFVSNPVLARSEFYELLARDFGLSEHARESKTRFLSELLVNVETRFNAGGVTTLIIDEAQSMPDDLLEEVRLLGNMETSTSKLLSIVLSGQPELSARLDTSSLRQLKQRLALRCELAPFTLEETASYISGRLRIVGATPRDVFTREAVIAIHEASAGIPRTINVLCENTLIGGLAAQIKPVSPEVVAEVCRDFHLGEQKDGDGAPSDAHSDEVTRSRSSDVSVDTALPSRPSGSPKPLNHARVNDTERPMFSSVRFPQRRRFFFF